jgi:TPR repeat protein
VNRSQVLRFLNYCSWTRLLAACFGRTNTDGQNTAAAGGRAPIVIGYSNALFSLGWHYERGGGASRNLSEADRCYRKSARLGNLDAMVRLAVGEAAAEPRRVVPVNG